MYYCFNTLLFYFPRLLIYAVYILSLSLNKSVKNEARKTTMAKASVMHIK